MINKVILIAILLLVGAQAQHFDLRVEAEFEDLMNRYGQDSLEVEDTKEDVVNFAKGFLEAIGSGKAFDEIRACLKDSAEISNKIVTGVKLIRTKNPEKVRQGVHLLGEAVKVIPVAAAECKSAHSDIQKLIRLVQMFTDPKSFLYHVGKSLLINRVEVIAEVRKIVDAQQRRDFQQVGFWTGRAMETIFLGGKGKLRQEMVDFINSEDLGWTAEIPAQFENETIDEMAASLIPVEMMDNMNFEDAPVMDYEGIDEDIPATFDSRTNWPGCVHGIMAQGKCGSCWAFAASEALSDRLCIASGKKTNVVLSPQFLVSCNNFMNHGCSGGNPFLSWKFLEKSGAVTEQCLPYQSGTGKNPVKCKTIKSCADNTPLTKYYAKKGSTVVLPNPKSIQMSILKDGPVEAGFMVYEDFKTYKSGVYKHTSGHILGGHAVKIIGWGQENGESHWIVANSWSEKWGENGFFRIAFGQCGIDKQCVVGLPDLSKTQQSHSDLFLF